MSTGRLAVLKFGGTSVASAETVRRIADIVVARRKQGFDAVVVVVSALSKVTDKLVRISQGEPVEPLLAEIDNQHLKLAQALNLPDDESVLQSWRQELSRIAALRAGASLPLTPAQQAQIQSAGELMSSRLLAQFFSRELKGEKLACHWQDAREWLTSVPQPHRGEISHYLNAHCEPVRSDIHRASVFERGGMTLTQGFIARNGRDETVILGRGGSDTSAAYLAALLGADVLEIWTDVPGMFTANPRQYPNAKLLRSLDYDEAQEMATTGAKVLHPRCVRPARLARIPIRIAHTGHPEMEGTWVQPQPEEVSGLKAVSVNKPITLISLETLGMWQQVGFMADLFAVFKQHGVSVDLVSTSETNITVTLDGRANDLAPNAMQALLADMNELGRVRVLENCAVVTLVGRNVHTVLHQLGEALKVFADYPVHLVTQAASDLNYSFVIDAEHADEVCARLHEFLLAHAQHPAVFGPDWQSLFGSTSRTVAPAWWRLQKQALVERAQTHAPCYVYSLPTVLAQVSALRELKAIDRLLYAMKANANPAVLQTLAAAGVDLECVSVGELDRVRKVLPELPADRILFTPNFAPRTEYETAFSRGVTVTLDNLYPLQQWPELFRDRKVLLRVDTGVGQGHHAHVRTAGQEAKFGIPLPDLDEARRLCAALNVRVIGLHAHTGSGIFDRDNWRHNADTLMRAASQFPDIEVLNLGGGLGVPYEDSQAALDLAAVNAGLQAFKAEHPQIRLWLEPGRYLVAHAGVLLARVTQIKGKGSRMYVGVETGMNSLLRPALYGACHRIVNLSRLEAEPAWLATIVGPICETGDKLGEAVLPVTQEGDVLLIAEAGAYGHVMSSHYNLRAPAQELILD
ncbi:bifunctional aspartate kinase/diaminopimelate decarboxylase [Permianibacter sp. IMCC34836]|uniref:bifunctional aspartate kinase/diaminopimelate decarboxylase n=1 Tax=Permianibacter fluminis TaxID=2738515 RepID=UPI001552151C|nr:bifunctional aspartate kinase/diaminopimelate decarboxylase [Permianibacter fluminis]NQD37527.1 bifunctional aspartate kinase/diaminopimelate decarboxylase [Permianibacter fluminis]